MAKDFRDLIRGKNILVTGGLGSIGNEIVKQLSNFSPRRITIFDNRETEFFYWMDGAKDIKNITTIFGDIRDKETVQTICNDIDIIYHAAAMKHVIICEKTPFEAVKTNVLGTQNLIEAARKNCVDRMVMISTDKAVNPSNVMGATKLLAERLVSAAYNPNQKQITHFSIVRFGNVLSSRGSVLEIWDKQIANSKPITITDPKMTRFFMSIPESVQLIFESTFHGGNGEIFIFKMPSVRVGDLAKAYLLWKGIDPSMWKVIGKKPGEKMHEELLSIQDEQIILENKIMFVCLPIFHTKQLLNDYLRRGFKINDRIKFISNMKDNILSIKEIVQVLNQME